MAKQEEAKTAQFTINEEGIVVDEEGSPLQSGEGDDALPVQITNAQTQTATDKVVKDRLAREKRKNDKHLETLQEQADKTPALQIMIDELQGKNDDLSGKMTAIEDKAKQEVRVQLETSEKRVKEAERLLLREQKARVTDGIQNSILAHPLASKFYSVSKDIAPELLAVHKREPNPDDPEQFVDLFRVPVPTEEGDAELKWVDLDVAMETATKRTDYSHYVKGNGAGGTGAAGTGKQFSGKEKLPSDMDTEEFAAWKKEQGVYS